MTDNASPSDSNPFSNRPKDLFIFATFVDPQGVIYHVKGSDLPQYKIPNSSEHYASVRDMLMAGAVLFGFPMDTNSPPANLVYAAKLPAIDITHPLTESEQDTPTPEVDTPPMQPNDLFLFGQLGLEKHPHLYRLPSSVYTRTIVNGHDAPSTILDLFAHGTALAAVPPTAGTLCYVINLATLLPSNPIYRLQ